MFLTLFSFISSPIGKIVSWAIGALAAAGILWGIVAYHDSQIKKEALLQYNQTQLQQTIKDQATAFDHLKQMTIQQQVVVDEANDKSLELNKKTDAIADYINAQPVSPTDTVSPILLETFKKLKVLDK